MQPPFSEAPPLGVLPPLADTHPRPIGQRATDCVCCVQNYNMIFVVAPAFLLLAIGCMWFVTRGEAKAVADDSPTS